MNYEVANSSLCYKKDPQCNVSGRYYNWAAAKVACPKGWHLPTKDEWATLFVYTYGSNCMPYGCEGGATPLKSQTGWNDDGSEIDPNGTDIYGFSLLPNGIRDPDGHFTFEDVEENGHNGYVYMYTWSATEEDDVVQGFVFIYNGDINPTLLDQNNGLPVRCVKD